MEDMKKKIIFLTFFLLLFSFAFPELPAYWIWTPETNRWINPKYEPKETPEEQFDWALSFYLKEDYKAAFKEFRKVLRYYPRSRQAPRARFYAGQCLEKRGDYYKAFKEYQKVIDEYPGSEVINEVIERQFKIGELFLKGKKKKFMGVEWTPLFMNEKAAEVFRKVIENAPYGEYADKAQFKLGFSFEKSRRYDEAVAEYKKLLKEYPESELVDEAKYRIALCLYKFSRPSDYDDSAALEAKQNFENFVKEHPDSLMKEKAQQRLRELNERESRKIFDIARFYERQGNFESAIIYYQEIIDKYPQTKWAQEAGEKIEELNKQQDNKVIREK